MTAFQISNSEHQKALHLIEEIKRQSKNLDHEYEMTGHVIGALAESVESLLQTARQVNLDVPF
jgi:hypothetical protein